VAAVPVKPAPITVAITPQLNCTTALGSVGTFEARSWSWGATNDGTIGGGTGTGQAQPASLTLTRASDACSPALLHGVMEGTIYSKLTLSQYDTGGVLKATVLLEDVMLSQWHVGGTTTSAEPIEELVVTSLKLTLTDVGSSNKVCWDVKANKAC
jgi:type VI protein secretion system component Hcp